MLKPAVPQYAPPQQPFKGPATPPVAEMKFHELENQQPEKKPGLKDVKVIFIDGSSQIFNNAVRVACIDDLELELSVPADQHFKSPVKRTLVTVVRDQIRWYSVVEEVEAK